uniref:cytoskeleton-associated protein 2 n=1 Tax=Doryrhamphus excisus TaxID=161450 RepID=UPI0025ADF64E|nr:cytoskeleton-associated protein 2 [Doryrhamphus excisus]
MNNTAVSRPQHTNRRGKENAPPGNKSTSFNRKDLSKSTRTAPLQVNHEKTEMLVKNGLRKATSKQADTKIKSMQRDVERNAVSGANSQVILSHQVPPRAATSSKVALGMYKGKIVQSKIGSIWKSSTAQAVPKTENQRADNLAKHPPKPAVAVRPPRNVRPMTTAATAPRNTGSRNITTAPTQTRTLVTDKKVKKPPVTSTLSQYRATETAQEKRAKLAEWLASKGKTLKRPAMTTAPPKTKTSTTAKVDNKLKSDVTSKPDPRREPEPGIHAVPTTSVCLQAQEAVKLATQTPVIINTTLDLLENSDPDLSAVQDGVDDVVVNLCGALDAMQTPSKCQDDADEEVGVIEDGSVKEETFKNEDSDQRVKDDMEESEQKVQSDEDQSDENVENVLQMDQASVVKYSVKTTPHLQSVKKKIQREVQTSASRKKSNIKDLKFLTPVRRSCRIEHRSSHLPPMLLDHDPCVSSLSELAQLDDDLNAYIYRKNPGLVEEP